jgi:squalene-hopene/tetraprenyl-beta-curcumene cyclase
MQPASGGFLEATPLTSFVVMCLAAMGRTGHSVTQRGLVFLRESMRPEGAWPIDTNLAAWVTTLSLGALRAAGQDEVSNEPIEWLLRCQHRQKHPYTGAAPGGWGWSDLSGAVPDADDTSSALLSLAHWLEATPPAESRLAHDVRTALNLGIEWLLDLQNRNGGWPTFCRGWGRLPFDRSGADLTAHALRALAAWRGLVGTGPSKLVARVHRAQARGLAYLSRTQRDDGAFESLWFGNQFAPGEVNAVHGASRVLLAYGQLGRAAEPAALRAARWLAANQNADGGWGGSGASGVDVDAAVFPASSVEETALAVEGLCLAPREPAIRESWRRGLEWLVAAVESGGHRRPSPIGLYFARLWYYERLYPIIFTVAALGRSARFFQDGGLESRSAASAAEPAYAGGAPMRCTAPA